MKTILLKNKIDIEKLNLYSIILVVLNLAFLISGHFIDFEINNLEKTSFTTNIIFGFILIHLLYGLIKIFPLFFKRSKKL